MPMFSQVQLVEARRIIDTNIDDVMSWCGGFEIGQYFDSDRTPIMGFLFDDGTHICLARMGDYVILDEGDFTVLNEIIFNDFYKEEII